MYPTRFDKFVKALAVRKSRRAVILGLGSAFTAAGSFHFGSSEGEVLARTGATPVPEANARPDFEPIYVSPNPIPIGGGEFFIDGMIIPLDPDAAAFLEGTPVVPISIDGMDYFIDPSIGIVPEGTPFGTPIASPEETICGGDDSQDVEKYEGDLGVTIDFVAKYQKPVGNIRWNSNLRDLYAEPGTVNARRWCSGTLITEDLFLTAGHCFSQQPLNHTVPSINGTDVPIPRAEIATNMHVDFNYQLDTSGLDQLGQSFPVIELVEDQLGDLDYAILRLGGNPGLIYGFTSVATSDAPLGTMICIIGHPEGVPKRIEAGPASEYRDHHVYYNDIDTAGGSSGSGILASPEGPIVGVHTNGGCTEQQTGHNHGVRISSLLRESPLLASLAGRERSS